MTGMFLDCSSSHPGSLGSDPGVLHYGKTSKQQVYICVAFSVFGPAPGWPLATHKCAYLDGASDQELHFHIGWIGGLDICYHSNLPIDCPQK